MRVTVEVVFQVNHDATPVRDGEVPHSVPYHVKVLVRSGLEYVRDLPQVRLGNDAHRGSAAVEEGADLRIVPREHALQDEDSIGSFRIGVPFCSHCSGDGESRDRVWLAGQEDEGRLLSVGINLVFLPF